MNIAIILASGRGKRMKAGKNKTLINLKGKPLIFYTLKNFGKSPEIDKILLVVGRREIDLFRRIIEKHKLKKILDIIPGGKERQYSAYNAVRFIDNRVRNKKDLVVVFHNGANPFVTKDEIRDTIKFSEKFGACAVAHKTKDTIRKVDKEGMSVGIIDRSNLWNMQTPQTIKFSLARKALEKAEEDNFLGTDDVSLVERLGYRVKIIEASENNFKITTPFDLKVAELIIKDLE